MMDVAPLVATGAGLTAASAVLGMRQALRAPDRRARERVAALLGTPPETRERRHVLRSRRGSRLQLLDRVFSRLNTERLQRSLDQAGLPLRATEYLAIRAALAAASAVAAVTLGSASGSPGSAVALALVASFVGWIAPALELRRRIGQRARRIDSQLVEMCDLMASMLASGFGYLQALRATATQLEPPLADELRRLLDAVELGGDVDEAFLDMSMRLNSADLDIVSTAIMIQRSSGGNLSEILRGVASTIRDRQAIRLELRTLTSRERFSALVVTFFPFAIVGLLTLLLPDTFGKLLVDPVGRMILGGAILLDTIGFIAIKRASKVEY